MSQLLQIHEPGETPLPHESVAAIGIDLGTTHSVVAIADDARVQAIGDAHGHTIIPSIVAYDGEFVTVGHAARDKLRAGAANVHASIKRQMGRMSGEASALPIQVSADILRHMKSIAEEALGHEVRQAVITVPAYFDDAARASTKDAARLAGLEVLRLINEPTAAALAYGLDTNAQGIFAIYDFGGGTFDVSILKLEDGVFQVLSTAGDTELGGDDVDAAIAAYCHPERSEGSASVDGKQNLCFAQDDMLKARAAKEALSEAEIAEMNGKSFTRAELDALAQPFVDRTLACVERALRDADLGVSQMDGVVLVGGSTRLLLVRREVERFFGKAPLCDLNPDEVVALGAAIQAQALTKGAEHLLLDVIPLSLGLETMGGIVEKVVHRNTPIPVAVTQEFTTYQDGQTAMKIHIVQGEREKMSDCRSLGEFTLTGIPPMVAGAARIAVMFTVDADGLLTVSAKETLTEVEQKITVTPSYGLSFEQIEQMLRESMENARGDILERLLIEARVEAERAIADVTRAMELSAELLKPGEKPMIEMQIATLRAAIAGTERDRIDHEAEQLNRLVGPFAQRRMDAAIQSALKGKAVGDVG
jgi:molecular chaperone HscA